MQAKDIETERRLDELNRDNKVLIMEIEALKGELFESKDLIKEKDEQLRLIYE